MRQRSRDYNRLSILTVQDERRQSVSFRCTSPVCTDQLLRLGIADSIFHEVDAVRSRANCESVQINRLPIRFHRAGLPELEPAAQNVVRVSDGCSSNFLFPLGSRATVLLIRLVRFTKVVNLATRSPMHLVRTLTLSDAMFSPKVSAPRGSVSTR